MTKLDYFIKKLTPTMMRDKSIIEIKNFLKVNEKEVNEIIFSCETIDDFHSFKIQENRITKAIFDWKTKGRGDTRGCGELLIVFLIKDGKFADDGDIKINLKKYEVKAYASKNNAISFGVKNSFGPTKMAKQLEDIFWSLLDKKDDIKFTKKYSYWFTKPKTTNNYSNMLNKFLHNEISSGDFESLFRELPKLKNEDFFMYGTKINFPYLSDITLLKSDIEDWNKQFNNNEFHIVLFVKGELYDSDCKLYFHSVTEGRIKVKLKK